MPVLDTTEAQAVNAALRSHPAAEEGEAAKHFPPIWILLAFVCLAFAAYYLILWLRGL